MIGESDKPPVLVRPSMTTLSWCRSPDGLDPGLSRQPSGRLLGDDVAEELEACLRVLAASGGLVDRLFLGRLEVISAPDDDDGHVPQWAAVERGRVLEVVQADVAKVAARAKTGDVSKRPAGRPRRQGQGTT